MTTPSSTLQTLPALLTWLRSSPPGTLLPAGEMYQVLSAIGESRVVPVDRNLSVPRAPSSWRELLWTAPAETRIGVKELAEALGKKKSWVYRQTAARLGPLAIPHRKLEGELVFVVGEIRAWLPNHEETIVAATTRRAPNEPGLRLRRSRHLGASVL